MKVIGAGLMRTGTMTMQAALETLGYHCYHMREVLKERGHIDAWHQFVTGQAAMDWHALFRKFEATVDTPACWYYKELMQAFPDAKVILTVREPERWYASFVTLCQALNSFRLIARVIPKLGKFVRFVDLLFANIFGSVLDRETCLRVFTEHNEAVQRFVPAERLLVFRPGDRLTVRALTDAHLMVLGGAAMDGPRYLWWNFVSSRKERIDQAKAEWKSGRFGIVPGDAEEFIPLPD